MSKTILVASAFGRGHWLAVELKRLGLNVALMDVTEKIGKWIPEEVEGPFGFFYSDRILDSQVESLQENDLLAESSTGFNIWIEDGPIELKGPTAQYRLQQIGVTETVNQYILSAKDRSFLADKERHFNEKWLAVFAHDLASPVDLRGNSINIAKNQSDLFLPLFSNFSTRQASRKGHEKSLQWLEREKIDVIRQADIVDLSLKSKNEIKGIEYKSAKTESSQVYECDMLIWCLSTEETACLGHSLKKTLFEDVECEPLWYWARYRVRLAETAARDVLPQHCVLIKDRGLPQYHENLLILQRTGSSDVFDVWCRLPHLQRFSKEYLGTKAILIKEVLESKIYQTSVDITEYPVGYESTLAESGPARHPIYSAESLSKRKVSSLQNVYFDSAELWSLLGLNGMFDYQLKIYQKIQDWWKKLTEVKK